MSAYRIAAGSTHGLPDTEDFLRLLDTFGDDEPPAFQPFFSTSSDIFVTRAPGRLDVMGGISDYSGSLVLQLPIADAAHAALQKTNDQKLRLISLPTLGHDRIRSLEMSLNELSSGNGPIEYGAAREMFSNGNKSHWAAYVAGSFIVLMREKGIAFKNGANILIRSLVPEGKGVSSSAALEVAVLKAVDAAYGLNLDGIELALLCQKVENLIAGAPCGIMDQMTSACGESDELLELLCQPCDLHGTLALPGELELWGLDSGVRHSVGGSAYTTVRTATFMGYRIIAELAGLKVTRGNNPDKLCIDDRQWNGYLANITPEEFEERFSSGLPGKLSGREFVERYQATTDSVTTVRLDVDYPIWQATRHPIYENRRVTQFAEILKNWEHAAQPELLGGLMFQSHESYSDCGLGSPETDLLVNLVEEARTEGLHGARITGGGSGGTVAVLGNRGSTDAIRRLNQRYQQKTGKHTTIISGSSPGASAFGSLRIIAT